MNNNWQQNNQNPQNPFGQQFGGGGAQPQQQQQQAALQHPFQTAPQGGRRQSEGFSLDKLDAFASQGFKAQQAGGGAGGQAMGQPAYSNVPLSQIPTKPPAADPFAGPMLPQAGYSMQQQQPQPQQFQGGFGGGGMYATAQPMQMGGPYMNQHQQLQQQQHPFMTAQPGGSMMMMPQQQQQLQQQQHPFNTSPPGQGPHMMGGLTSGMGGMSLQGQGQGSPPHPPALQQQQSNPFSQQQPQHMQDPFATAPPPAPQSFAPGIPAAGGGQGGGGGNQWDPFGTSAAAGVRPPQAQLQQPQAQAGAWDPFSGGSSSPPQNGAQNSAGPAGSSADAGGWGDLTDADIWGDQKADTGAKAGGSGSRAAPGSNSDDDEAEWSDDDGAASDASPSDASRSPNGSPNRGGGGGARGRQQVESDFELAQRLQREEDARVNGGRSAAGAASSGYGGRTSHSPARNSAGDRPDGECLARISKRTLLVKVWKPTYFIFELPDLLLLYRSRDDYIYNPKGTMIKKRIEIKHNHTLTPLKRKLYKDYGYLWHFTIEEQMDYGPSVIAKFAFQEKRALEDLGNRIAEAIREKRRVRSRLNNYAAQSPSPPPSAVYNAAGGSPQGSRGGTVNQGRRTEYDYGGARGNGASGSSGARGSGGGGGGEDRDKYSKWGNIS